MLGNPKGRYVCGFTKKERGPPDQARIRCSIPRTGIQPTSPLLRFQAIPIQFRRILFRSPPFCRAIFAFLFVLVTRDGRYLTLRGVLVF